MERYEVVVNVEGEEHIIIVRDLELANRIHNDPQLATIFINSQQEETDSRTPNLVTYEPETLMTEDVNKDGIIWVKKKADAVDMEATKLLLQLRREKSALFDDKKSRKVKLWLSIALAIKEKGFILGPNGGEKCRQKFANLMRAYFTYIKKRRTTDVEAIEKPIFFEEMHSILRRKRATQPAKVKERNNQPSFSHSGSYEPATVKTQQDPCTKQVLWGKGKPDAVDLEATRLLLQLRSEKAALFNDTKTHKWKLWLSIASAIKEKGFPLGPRPAEKCRQKFANLMRSYVTYIENKKRIDASREEKPVFFDEMRSILGKKRILLRSRIRDSIDQPSSSHSGLEPKLTENTESDTSRMFNNETDLILNEIRLDREERKRQFVVIEKYLEKSSQQRERLINIVEQILCKKRKRNDDSGSD